MKTQALIVSSENAEDIKFLKQVLDKMGYQSAVLPDEVMEDLGLLTAMLSEPRGEYVSEQEVLKVLDKK
jgi:hypothetical protein